MTTPNTPIPLSLVQSGIDLTEPKPTMSGAVLTWVQRWGKRAAIVGAPIDGGPVQLVSHGPDPAPGRGLSGGCYAWAKHDTALIYVADDGQLWSQPSGGGAVRQLSDVETSCRAPAVDTSPAGGDSEFVVYVLDEREVRLTSLTTGQTQRLDDGRHEFCFDPAVSPDASTVSWIGWSPPHMPWDAAVRIDCSLRDGTIRGVAVTNGAIQQPRFAPDGTPMQVHDASGWLNVYLGDRPVVAETVEHAAPTWGMGQRSFAISDDGSQVAFTRNEAGFGSLAVADIATGVVTQLARGVHGHVVWLPGANAVAAIRSGARTQTEIVVYDLAMFASQAADGAAASGDAGAYAVPRSLAVGPNAAWTARELPEPELVETPSADGRCTLHARRFVAGNARLLVWVHGGPTDQWQVDWRPRITYWWSRGWDVLVVDPRGTTGHGRSYQQALAGGWGRLDVDDTADLIEHAHRHGWSTPETTVVIGGSSGGLTVLGVMADHPGIVTAGVASYPVSDLRALSEIDHRFEAHYTDTLVGRPDHDRESDSVFRRLSPLFRADRITAPLLLFHGTDDPVVPIAQSNTLVERIRSSGGSVDYVVYEGEGHGFSDSANVTDEYERTEAFLDLHTVDPA